MSYLPYVGYDKGIYQKSTILMSEEEKLKEEEELNEKRIADKLHEDELEAVEAALTLEQKEHRDLMIMEEKEKEALLLLKKLEVAKIKAEMDLKYHDQLQEINEFRGGKPRTFNVIGARIKREIHRRARVDLQEVSKRMKDDRSTRRTILDARKKALDDVPRVIDQMTIKFAKWSKMIADEERFRIEKRDGPCFSE